MGCGPSKQQETPLVRLCRERRDLILSAARNRFALAAAYSAYIRSMAAFGDLLQGFVTNGFVPDAMGSPVLRIPGDRKSSKGDLSSTSLSHSLSDPSPSDSHLHFESDESETELLSPEYGPPPIEASPSSPVRESPIWSFSPAMNYVKSTAIPAVVFAELTPEEERMRLMYEKKSKRLKMLDRKGAEVDQIQSTQLSIRKQLTKISMSIKSIDAISNKIHGIRDTELQSQLTKLIHGMMQMWEVLLACHKKQLQAISEGKTVDIISRSASRDSTMEATMLLEQGASGWSSSFLNWMKAQRAYVEFLNGWLSRCITDQEPEVTEDGVVPFSPGRIGAPPVFVVCNDWCQMMKRVSEDQVLEAIDTFAANMHRLWEQLDQERCKSLENEHLSKDLNQRVRLLQQDENNMRIQRLANTAATSVTEDFETSLADRKMVVDEMKRRLDEEKQKHAEMMRQVEVGTLTMLKTGLVRIFEAMVDFANSNIKAYEDIRIPNGLDT